MKKMTLYLAVLVVLVTASAASAKPILGDPCKGAPCAMPR